jgi:hypothetical protein
MTDSKYGNTMIIVIVLAIIAAILWNCVPASASAQSDTVHFPLVNGSDIVKVTLPPFTIRPGGHAWSDGVTPQGTIEIMAYIDDNGNEQPDERPYDRSFLTDISGHCTHEETGTVVPWTVDGIGEARISTWGGIWFCTITPHYYGEWYYYSHGERLSLGMFETYWLAIQVEEEYRPYRLQLPMMAQ